VPALRQTIPRASIARIGLDGRRGEPPAVADPNRDAVHLVDGQVRSGHVVGISLGFVVLDEDETARPSVTRVRFAGPPAAHGAPPGPTPTPTPGGSGQLWTGTIAGRYWRTMDGVVSQLDVVIDARVREVRTSPLELVTGPTAKDVGVTIQLEPGGVDGAGDSPELATEPGSGAPV
jgi:hypothetical protein